MRHIFLIVTTAALLSACSSVVKLDTFPEGYIPVASPDLENWTTASVASQDYAVPNDAVTNSFSNSTAVDYGPITTPVSAYSAAANPVVREQVGANTDVVQDTTKLTASRITPIPVEIAKPAPSQDTALGASSSVVYFDYDSAVIKPEFQTLIAMHARFIRDDRTKRIVIEGHTDERGGREYNLALGQKRAEVMRNAMTLLGVADSQLEAVSFGEEKPAVTGHTEAVWGKNRRAEISYR